jgi:hypothetical protein
MPLVLTKLSYGCPHALHTNVRGSADIVNLFRPFLFLLILFFSFFFILYRLSLLACSNSELTCEVMSLTDS